MKEIQRRLTRTVTAGGVKIGGGHPLTVQSMTNTPAGDINATVAQIKRLERAGCDIVRMAVPDTDSAVVFTEAKKQGVLCPLVADIHFDYRIALEALRCGADKIRINPGNIGSVERVREVASACRLSGVPIRIGVNGGSLDKRTLKKYGRPCAEALAESALEEAEQLESCGFSDIVISIKSSDISEMTAAAELVSKSCDYPLHLGVTEAGDDFSGLIKNSIGIGSLLLRGIGDTIRVSLTADPVTEVRAGAELLRSLGLYERGGINIVSCPTCGRTRIDLQDIGRRYRAATEDIDTHGRTLNVALMGCAVNGPGEAREADFGIAGGDGFALLFRHGESVCRVEEERVIDVLLSETLAALKDNGEV